MDEIQDKEVTLYGAKGIVSGGAMFRFEDSTGVWHTIPLPAVIGTDKLGRPLMRLNCDPVLDVLSELSKRGIT